MITSIINLCGSVDASADFNGGANSVFRDVVFFRYLFADFVCFGVFGIKVVDFSTLLFCVMVPNRRSD